jgi:signal transduction histidine kinase
MPHDVRAATPPLAASLVRAAAPDPRSRLDLPELQSVLSHALTDLLAETRATHAAAWWAEPGEEPRVVAAAGASLPDHTPLASDFERIAALPGARDLRECDAATGTAGEGYCAAVPIAANADGAAAVLLLGGARDATGHVRPRTLAALDAVARRIEQPILASLAHARLARLDADVLRLDRLVALGTLVAEVVHEVRNPLVSVKTFLQLLPERRGDPEFLQSFLDVAGDELQRIERLLDLLLDHASPRMPAPGSGSGASIATVVEAVARLVAHRGAAAGVRIESEVAAALPHGAIEPDALRQVLLNLVLNALDVTPAGGDVRIAARSIGRVVQIDVEDRGPGIPRALRRRVFEPFFSTKAERPGGLGLAISRRLVDQAAGTLAIADRPGGGTRFRMRLPTTPAPTA